MGRSVSSGWDPSFIDLAAILQQLPCFISLLDRSRKLMWASNLAFGHTPDLSLGRTNEDIIHPEDRDFYVHAVRLALETVDVTQGFVRVSMPDQGPLMRMFFRVGPYRHDKQIVGALSLCWDVTFHSQPSPLSQFLFTPRSKKVVEFLYQHGPRKGVVIGKYLGELSADKKQASSKCRITLSSLEERKIIRNSIEGYELTPEFLESYLHSL